MTENQLRSYAEPLMHLCAVGFGIVTAVVSLKLTLFNNADLWCWIAPLPFDCKESHIYGFTTCIRGDNAFIYRWAFFYAPLWLCMFTVLVLNGLAYWHAKTGEKDAMDREANHVALHGNRTARDILSGQPNTNPKHNVTSMRLNNPRHRRATILKGGSVKRPSFFGFEPFESEGNREGHSHIPSFSMVLPEKIVERLRSHGLFRNFSGDTSCHISNSESRKDPKHSSTNSADIRHVLQVIEDYPSAARQYTAAYQFGTRIVVSQCLAYTAFFFLAWTFSSVNRVVQHSTNTNFFGLLLCQSIFEPLQGLFNVLVYRYAFYLRLKLRYPHLSRWDLFISTWRWTYLGPPPGVQERTSLTMAAGQGRASSKRVSKTSLPTPPIKSLYQTSQSQNRDSTIIDRSQDSRRGSAISDEVNVLNDDSFHAANKYHNDLMADLMVDYFEDPSMLNQKMVSIQTDFPFYVSEEKETWTQDEDASTLQFSPNSLYPVVTPIHDFQTMAPLEDAIPPTPNDTKKHDSENEEAIERSSHDFHIPSGRSETLISIDSGP